MRLRGNKKVFNLHTNNFVSEFINIKKYFSAKELKFIAKIGEYADEFGIKAYLVGGFVRDLFLGKKNMDLDITVEGDGIKFTEFLARKLNFPFKCFEKFKTGKIFLKNSNIDITSARSEYYKEPAALPDIKFSAIQKDLYRRDFTINAMAIQINKCNFGKFIDFFSGLKDLKNGIIRILHNKSFNDDPTRILRAIRFEQRFGFKIERKTLNLLKQTIKKDIFKKLPGERLRDEILLILKEKNAYKILKRGMNLGIWEKIFNGLKFNKTTEKILKNIDIFIKIPVFKNIDMECVYLMLFFYSLNLNQTHSIIERLKLKNQWKNKILNAKKAEKNICKQIKNLKNNKKRIFILLKEFDKEELFYFVLIYGKSISVIIEKYLKIYSQKKLYVTGEDLKKIGIKQGPVYKKIFLDTLLEKIDGKITTKSQEIEFIKNKLKGGR